MEVYLATGVAALAASTITLFSGFGLATLLMPVFAVFFPIPVAVASTAVVHVLNNLFKLALLGKKARAYLLVWFGLPAVVAAFGGAALLGALATMESQVVWRLAGRDFTVSVIGLVMGLLIVGFAVLELVPARRVVPVPRRWLPAGGVLSGFFGGLSGHQGALRAVFLTPLGLPPTNFAATQAALGSMVDVARISVYGAGFLWGRGAVDPESLSWSVVAFATGCAFAGAMLGRSFLPKTTIRFVRTLTGILLMIIGVGLATGVM